MKTYQIKDLLKKDLLILELPRVCDYKLTKEMIFIMDKERSAIHRFKGSYTLLGKSAEIKEEDASEIVEKVFTFYKDYNKTNRQFNFAAGSLRSAIESVIFWENPIEIPSSDDINWFRNQPDGDFSERYTRVFNWYDNQSRTFDRTRTLIFVKN